MLLQLGDTALIKASKYGYLDIVSVLVENGADIEIINVFNNFCINYVLNNYCWHKCFSCFWVKQL